MSFYVNPADYSVWAKNRGRPMRVTDRNADRDEAVKKAVHVFMQKQPNMRIALVFLDVSVVNGVFRNGVRVSGDVRLSVRQVEDNPEVNRLIPVDIELPDVGVISRFVQDTRKVVKAVANTRELDQRELKNRKSMYSGVCSVIKTLVSDRENREQTAGQQEQQANGDQ